MCFDHFVLQSRTTSSEEVFPFRWTLVALNLIELSTFAQADEKRLVELNYALEVNEGIKTVNVSSLSNRAFFLLCSKIGRKCHVDRNASCRCVDMWHNSKKREWDGSAHMFACQVYQIVGKTRPARTCVAYCSSLKDDKIKFQVNNGESNRWKWLGENIFSEIDDRWNYFRPQARLELRELRLLTFWLCNQRRVNTFHRHLSQASRGFSP